MRRLFVKPRSRRLLLAGIGMGVAEFGDIAYLISLTAGLYLLHGSATHVAFGTAAYGFGSLVGSWVGGHLADRLPAQRWLIMGNAVAAAVVLANGLANSLVMVIAFAALVSASSRAMLVSQQSSLPLVEPDPAQITKANAFIMLCRRLGQLIGPGLAGVLVAAGEITWVYALNATTFLIAGTCGSLAVRLGARSADAGSAATGAAIQATTAVTVRLRDCLAAPAVRTSFLVNSMAGIVSGASGVSVVVYTGTVLHGGAREYGLLATFSAVGSVLGTLTAPIIDSRWPTQRSVVAILTVSAVSIGVLPFAGSFPFAAVCRVGSGWSVNVLFIVLIASLQRGARPESRGRLIAATRSGQDFLVISVTMLSGVLIGAIGVRSLLATVGVLGLTTAALVLSTKNAFDWSAADPSAPTSTPPQAAPQRS